MDLTRRKFLSLVGGSAAGAVLFQACGVPEPSCSWKRPSRCRRTWSRASTTGTRPCAPSVRAQRASWSASWRAAPRRWRATSTTPSTRASTAFAARRPSRVCITRTASAPPWSGSALEGEGRWEEISWTDAIARLAHALGQIEDRSSVVLATAPVGGHLAKVVERFASRTGVTHMPYETLDETNLRQAIRQTYGLDVMPDFDIGNTAYLLSFGGPTSSRRGASPVRYARAYGQFRQGDRERGSHVHLEPRLSTDSRQRRRVGIRQPRMGGPSCPIHRQRNRRGGAG